jgi:hypothetical protein
MPFKLALSARLILAFVSGSLFFFGRVISVHYGLSVCAGLQALFYFFALALSSLKK